MNTNHEEILKNALELEKTVSALTDKYRKISNETYMAMPQPPVLVTVEKQYPKVTSDKKFSWALALIPSLFFFPWILIYYLIWKSGVDQDILQKMNSEEYKNICSNIDREWQEKQTIENENYKKAMDNYNSVTIPEYNMKKDAWRQDKANRREECVNNLNTAKIKLESLYADTRIVPLQYRNIPALQYIYDMVSTSDYDVRQAIESYDKKVQRDLEIVKIKEQQYANKLADEQNQLAYEQNDLLNEKNDLLDEQNAIANKARRDANISAAVSAIQRHNTNKTLNKMLKK